MLRVITYEVLQTIPKLVPMDVFPYLLPHERSVITVRRHPIVLAPAVCLVTANVTALALSAANVIRGGAVTVAVLGILLPLSCYLLYAGWRAWLRAYVVITNSRIMLINVPWKKSLIIIPLAEAYNLRFVRTLIPGRFVGYGAFLIKKPGTGKRTSKIRYLPYPEQLYLEVVGLLLPADQDSRPAKPRPVSPGPETTSLYARERWRA